MSSANISIPDNEKDFVSLSERIITSIVEEFRKKAELEYFPVIEFAMQIEEELFKRALYDRPVELNSKEMWKSRDTTAYYMEYGERIIRNIRDREEDWRKIYDRYFKKDSKGAFIFFSQEVRGNARKSQPKNKVEQRLVPGRVHNQQQHTHTPALIDNRNVNVSSVSLASSSKGGQPYVDVAALDKRSQVVSRQSSDSSLAIDDLEMDEDDGAALQNEDSWANSASFSSSFLKSVSNSGSAQTQENTDSDSYSAAPSGDWEKAKQEKERQRLRALEEEEEKIQKREELRKLREAKVAEALMSQQNNSIKAKTREQELEEQRRELQQRRELERKKREEESAAGRSVKVNEADDLMDDMWS